MIFIVYYEYLFFYGYHSIDPQNTLIVIVLISNLWIAKDIIKGNKELTYHLYKMMLFEDSGNIIKLWMKLHHINYIFKVFLQFLNGSKQYFTHERLKKIFYVKLIDSRKKSQSLTWEVNISRLWRKIFMYTRKL